MFSDGARMTDDGRLFHSRAAATVNARSPSVDLRVGGTISDVPVADLRRRRELREQRPNAKYEMVSDCKTMTVKTQTLIAVCIWVTEKFDHCLQLY